MSRLRFSAVLGFGILVLATIVVIVVNAARPASPPPAAAAPHFWLDPSVRTIVVAQPGEDVARQGDLLLTELVSGAIPAGAREAVVLTDSNCVPDHQGISHCLNKLAINSTEVVVQHHHDMSKVPCLTPGETVNLIDVATMRQLPSS